jgi:tetratricopeptide (TPR) repeat protein
MVTAIRAGLLFFKGQRLINRGDFKTSITILEKALLLKPDNGSFHLHKGLAHMALKYYGRAESDFRKAIALDPDKPAYHLFHGICLHDSGRNGSSIDAFVRAHKLAPDNFLALCYKELALLDKHPPAKEGLVKLKRYINGTNSDFQGRFLFACEKVLFENQQPSASLAEGLIYESLVETSVFVRIISRGSSFFRKMAVAFSPAKSAANNHVEAGNSKIAKGMLKDAVSDYQSALGLVSDSENIMDTLLDLYVYNRDYPSVLKYLKQLEPYKKIAPLLYRPDNDDAGQKERESRLAGSLFIVYMLGFIHFHMGEYDRAITLLEFVTSKEHGDYIPPYYLGLCHVARQKKDEAVRFFTMAMERQNPRVAERRLNELERCVGKQGQDISH